MPMEHTFDAIVIGAGPAGSTSAILLANAGWRVAIVDKDGFPREKVCGGCIAASNLPLLEALGIGDGLLPLIGPPLRQVAFVCGDRMVRASLPPYADPAHPWGAALRREHLDTLLLEQARQSGATIFQPWTAGRVEGGAGQFRCHIRAVGASEKRTLAAPVLIDAHGSWQPLQYGSGKDQRSRSPSDLLAFKADFTGARLDQGVLPVLSFPGGYGGMVVTDHGAVTLAFCMRRETLEKARLRHPGCGPQEAAANWVIAHCGAVRDMLAGAAQERKWIATGPIRPGIRIGQHAGQHMQHAFLVGNAAGETHPIIGEGMSMAIQSAILLADMLGPHRRHAADAQWQAALQIEYARAWRRHFAGRIRLAAVFAHAAMRPALCGGVLPLLQRYPALLERFARWSGKVRPGPRMEANRIVGYQ
ncbi:NAD(P)/FAD-dependent oxidoreductase [Noviherbaspirillum aerium]|uniref:NAD(P)/FAD-dependent oxidoreductase n=1 Tax=Noviherbaspirillum aerium TaxID=2588497 RepID=UPI00124DB35C|nr:NAD(P)/FAD-dependent oxidoreductase [Noviherbaspirillum aerium]